VRLRGSVRQLSCLSIMFVLLAAACTPTRPPAATLVPASAPTQLAADDGPPHPNPLPAVPEGGNKDYAPVQGADLTKNGLAASMHGSASAGQVVFAQNCQTCHGAEGKVGIPNPGSDDGSVPVMNPLDPTFVASASGDPEAFARALDLFVQHGSRPSGANPTFSMIPWGDQQKLTQQEIADVEAYMMQLNGLTWPAQ